MKPMFVFPWLAVVIAEIALVGLPVGCAGGSQESGGATRTGGSSGNGGANGGGAGTDALPGTGGAGTGGAGTGGAGTGGTGTGGGAAGAAGGASSGGATTADTSAGGSSAGGAGRGGAPSGGAGAGGAGAGGTGAGGTIANGGAGGAVSGGGTGGKSAGTGGAVAGRGGTGGAGTGGATAGGAGGTPGPSTFKVFDQIPQFGIYATTNPKNYTPPAGMLMWSFGTVIVAKLADADKARILSKLAARITYHAQCDNYDRLGSLFFIAKPAGQAPAEKDPRIEIVRYITPFSDYNRGALATYVFPEADVSAYASTLADAAKDVWLGIVSGANPYDGDPCTNAGVTPEFRQAGYKISVELLSSGTSLVGPGITLSAKSYTSETKLPIQGTFANPGDKLGGRITVIVSGHGSDSGGNEYMNTNDILRANDVEVGSFSTKIDCSSYARYSPDGNQGIFRNNDSSNPRNWCPGALVPAHTYPVTLGPGTNAVTLSITPSQVPSGSYYATTINFTSP